MSFPLRRFGAGLRALSVAALAAGLVMGCEKKEDVRAYQAPKETPSPLTVATANAAAAASSAPQWDVPEGWKEVPGPKERVATFAVSKDEPGAVLAVTKFSGGVPLLANINRWAGQIGMPPVAEADVPKVSRQIDTKAGKADVVDITGAEAAGKPAQRMLAAIVPEGGQNWYFKLTGSKELVESQKDKFEAFVKSVHFTEGQPGQAAAAPAGDLPPGHPPVASEGPPAPGAPSSPPEPSASADSEPAAGPIAKWTTPTGWVRHSSGGGGIVQRVLSFTVPAGSEMPADVSVTRMGPSDPLANINRWRGQVDLPPIQDVNAANGEPVTVSGDAGRLFDFQGPKNRILVAMVPHAGQLWFFKMTGPADPVGAQKDNFKSFVTSVQFAQ